MLHNELKSFSFRLNFSHWSMKRIASWRGNNKLRATTRIPTTNEFPGTKVLFCRFFIAKTNQEFLFNARCYIKEGFGKLLNFISTNKAFKKVLNIKYSWTLNELKLCGPLWKLYEWKVDLELSGLKLLNWKLDSLKAFNRSFKVYYQYSLVETFMKAYHEIFIWHFQQSFKASMFKLSK